MDPRNGDTTAAGHLLRVLGCFDEAAEIDAALIGSGPHPARYALESFAAGDLDDDEAEARLARHIESCPSCRSEIEAFRALLRAESGTVVALSGRRRSGRILFALPLAAAASGGAVRRSSPDATIEVSALAGVAGVHVIAIRLADPDRRPHLLRLTAPTGEVLEQELPAPDKDGLIQLVKTTLSPREAAFITLIAEAPLEFLDRPED
jgi:hypothetical protein